METIGPTSDAPWLLANVKSTEITLADQNIYKFTGNRMKIKVEHIITKIYEPWHVISNNVAFWQV